MIGSEHYTRSTDSCDQYDNSESFENGLSLNVKAEAALELDHICRVCLAVDVKMHHMSHQNLRGMYELLTGVYLSEDDGFPQKFCWECAQRLMNGSKLRRKALKTQSTLVGMLDSGRNITREDIKAITSNEGSDWKSSLTHTSKVDNFDFEFKFSDIVFKCEIQDDACNFNENNASQLQEATHAQDVRPAYEIDVKDEFVHNSNEIDKSERFSKVFIEIESSIIKEEVRDEQDITTDRHTQPALTRITFPVENDLRKKLESQGITELPMQMLRERLLGNFKPKKSNIGQLVCTQGNNLITKDLCNNTEGNNINDNVTNNTINTWPFNKYYFNLNTNINHKVNIANKPVDNVPSNSQSIEEKILSREKKYKCHLCDSKYYRQSHLNAHIRKHYEDKTNIPVKDKKFACEICDYKSYRKDHLKVHQRRHTGEKPYICHFCDYRSAVRTSLVTHIKYKHLKVKSFACDICDYKCVTKCGLNMHKRVHSAEKPYKCAICNFTCSRRNALKDHIRFTHIKEKIYACDSCDYKCVKKDRLIVHIRTHTGEKPFECYICDYKSSQHAHLKMHLMTRHAD